MTTTSPPSDGDCIRTVLAILEWIDDNDVSDAALSEAFHILMDERRRTTLEVVHTYGEALTLADVAEEVATREYDRAVTDISAETISEVYISLYHDHLPRLTDAGLLEYEQERDLVAPGSA
ncbi:DUF7344 domain-containing protein [Natronobiforma cellulositropha]|uniref:DUF7344 domain-containing protein n=1 Tax=Natronobiforma cellulositropha TaxID=1679076 RepID=UPI0021D5D719|nr:hypothetical protein [Natronobiforma cellulositropha]